MSAGYSDTLDDIVRQWARAKIQRIDIMNYNGANLAYTHGADMANRLGLSDTQRLGVTPFPASTSVRVDAPPAQPEPPVVPVPSASPAPSRWTPVLAGLGGGLLGAGAMLAAEWIGGPTSPPTQPDPATVVRPGEVGLKIEGVPDVP